MPVGLLFVIRHVRQVLASAVNRGKEGMTVKRMDNVLIVVDDVEAAKAFFIELGLKLEGRDDSRRAFGWVTVVPRHTRAA